MVSQNLSGIRLSWSKKTEYCVSTLSYFPSDRTRHLKGPQSSGVATGVGKGKHLPPTPVRTTHEIFTYLQFLVWVGE